MNPLYTEMEERRVEAADAFEQQLARMEEDVRWEYAEALAFAEKLEALAVEADKLTCAMPQHEITQNMRRHVSRTTGADIADLLRTAVSDMGADSASVRDLADMRLPVEWAS